MSVRLHSALATARPLVHNTGRGSIHSSWYNITSGLTTLLIGQQAFKGPRLTAVALPGPWLTSWPGLYTENPLTLLKQNLSFMQMSGLKTPSKLHPGHTDPVTAKSA